MSKRTFDGILRGFQNLYYLKQEARPNTFNFVDGDSKLLPFNDDRHLRGPPAKSASHDLFVTGMQDHHIPAMGLDQWKIMIPLEVALFVTGMQDHHIPAMGLDQWKIMIPLEVAQSFQHIDTHVTTYSGGHGDAYANL